MSMMPWYVFVADAVWVFTLLVVAPNTSGVVAYAASQGIPRGFSRTKYCVTFMLLIAASGLLMGYAGQMLADVRTIQYAWQATCFQLGALLFGIAGGCVVAILTYRDRLHSSD